MRSWHLLLAIAPLVAQPSSTYSYTSKGGQSTVEIRNVTYEVTSTNVPGRPPNERLALRKTVHSKSVIDEIGEEATTTIEAWPLGVDFKQKPVYALTLTGSGGEALDSAIWVAARGLEEVEWWSVHKLGNGQHLFDTYVPVIRFSIARDVQTLRYAGLEIPPDDTKDARLKEPHVVGVLTYASADKVIREAMITSDDPKQAQMLRSYADESRELSQADGRTIKLSFSANYPSPANTSSIVIPIVRDDLDLAHAQLPARVHVAAWKR